MECIFDLLLFTCMMFSPSYISCISVSEKRESIVLDIHKSNKTNWFYWILSELFRQFLPCSGSGPDLGWESTQQVLRDMSASTAGET